MFESIYEILTGEHDEARQILERLAESSPADTEMRREQGAGVAIDLISHNEAESRILYARLLEFDALHDEVNVLLLEMEELNEKLRVLLGMDVEDGEWLVQLLEIKEDVECHIRDEETRLFPKAKRYLDQAESEELADWFIPEQFRRRGIVSAA